MDASVAPRAVIVTRPSEYETLLARHGTREQARFYLETYGQRIAEVERRHRRILAAVEEVSQAIPTKWRRSHVSRPDLDRFVFEPADIVIAVGQDGLVANAAKYLSGQRVIGLNPDPESYDGILVRHRVEHVGRLLLTAAAERCEIEPRTMVEAATADGQRLLALNEVFVGHRSHQSARYRLNWNGKTERQSSSGVIVSTGTGATGWARSISRERQNAPELPAPTDERLAFFVREAFPSVSTGTDITAGTIEGDRALDVVSEMNDGGVVFGDGIEEDRVDFAFGMTAHIRIANQRLQLVT